MTKKEVNSTKENNNFKHVAAYTGTLIYIRISVELKGEIDSKPIIVNTTP